MHSDLSKALTKSGRGACCACDRRSGCDGRSATDLRISGAHRVSRTSHRRSRARYGGSWYNFAFVTKRANHKCWRIANGEVELHGWTAYTSPNTSREKSEKPLSNILNEVRRRQTTQINLKTAFGWIGEMETKRSPDVGACLSCSSALVQRTFGDKQLLFKKSIANIYA